MKDHVLIYFLFASFLVHILAVPIVSILVKNPPVLSRHYLIPIDLLDLPRQEEKKEPVTLPKTPRPIRPRLPLQREHPRPLVAPEPSRAEPVDPKRNEPEKATPPSPSPAGGGDAQSIPAGSPGKETEAGDFFGGGDVAARTGEGLGKSRTGRGERPPGPGTGERGFREAKPVQTARASYPPMALRMGLEADVTLKIFVDNEGKVARVEIVKSAGMGFDEEALKAVKQFRFEPARKDGGNVPSEFTYIYRFRLEK